MNTVVEDAHEKILLEDSDSGKDIGNLTRPNVSDNFVTMAEIRKNDAKAKSPVSPSKRAFG